MPFPTNTVDLAIAGYRFDNKARCSACRAEIQWWITPKNRKMPLDDRTLIPHWGTCPAAAQFKKKKSA